MNNKRSVELVVNNKNVIPDGKKGYFQFSAGHDKNQKWKLIVRKGRRSVINEVISDETAKNGWKDFKIDISDAAGKESVGLTFLAENLDGEPALNYWGDMRFVVE